jgi:hypothetical protein
VASQRHDLSLELGRMEQVVAIQVLDILTLGNSPSGLAREAGARISDPEGPDDGGTLPD